MKFEIIIFSCISLLAFSMDVPPIRSPELSSNEYNKRLSMAISQDNQEEIEALFKLPGSAWKIEYLLSENKLDPNEHSKKGHALIHWVTRGNNPDILEILLKDPRTLRDIKNKNGSTALGFAVAQGKVATTKLLLHYEANPNIVNESQENEGDHYSMLHSAVMAYSLMGISYRSSYFDIIKLLISNEKTWVNEQDISGKTPLHYAVLLCDTRVVRLLLQCKRVNVAIKDENNKTALDYVYEKGRKDLVKPLLSCQ